MENQKTGLITIYGSPQSSAGRCFWCLEEIGIKYNAQPISFKDKEHRSEVFLKINPRGKVPALVDGTFNIWESVAINYYLAEAYKPELLGCSAKEKGLVQQWSLWAMTEFQPPLIAIFIQLIFTPEERRDLKIIEKSKEKLPPLLELLDLELKSKSYLINDSFSLADLNLLSVIKICDPIEYNISAYSNIQSWINRISERPAYKRYQELCQ